MEAAHAGLSVGYCTASASAHGSRLCTGYDLEEPRGRLSSCWMNAVIRNMHRSTWKVTPD